MFNPKKKVEGKRVDFSNVEKQQIKNPDIRLNQARWSLLNIQQNFIVCVKSN